MTAPGSASSDPYTDEELAARGLTRESLPKHVAFIMDGNGRWAQMRSQPRGYGHAKGADTVEFVVEECARIGLEQITLYCFSQENWKRPEAEQKFLFELLERYVIEQRPRIARQNLRFATIGDLEPLPASARDEIGKTKELSSPNTGMTLCLALNYGSRQEITAAVRTIAAAVDSKSLTIKQIDEAVVSDALHTAGMPDPDLVVRTAGELRLSNFLLWQLSYAEIWVTDVLWPDFQARELHAALAAFGSRSRRFGGLNA